MPTTGKTREWFQKIFLRMGGISRGDAANMAFITRLTRWPKANKRLRAMVEAQLAEQLLPILEAGVLDDGTIPDSLRLELTTLRQQIIQDNRASGRVQLRNEKSVEREDRKDQRRIAREDRKDQRSKARAYRKQRKQARKAMLVVEEPQPTAPEPTTPDGPTRGPDGRFQSAPAS